MMYTMFRIYILSILLCSMVRATVVQHVFTAKTPTSGTSSNLRNEGQSQHYMYVQWSNSGGTCNPDGTVYLQYSFDSSTWTNLTPTARPESSHNNEIAIFGAGTYPFVRVNSLTNYANCALDVWYVGTTNPIAFPQSLMTYQTGYQTVQKSISANSNSLLVGANTSLALGQNSIVLYGLQVSNSSTTDNGTLSLFTPNTANDCTSGTSTVNQAIVALLANTSVSYWPTSVVPYVTYVDPAKGLCAITTTGTWHVSLTFRLE